MIIKRKYENFEELLQRDQLARDIVYAAFSKAGISEDERDEIMTGMGDFRLNDSQFYTPIPSIPEILDEFDRLDKTHG